MSESPTKQEQNRGHRRAPGAQRVNGYVNMLLRQRDPPRFYAQLQKRYGDVAYFRFGPVHSFLVSDPELVRDVFVTHAKKFGRPIGAKILRKMMLGNGLLTSDGPFHLRQRRMIQPAFHRQRIAGYAKVMVDHARGLSDRWAQQAAPQSSSHSSSHSSSRSSSQSNTKAPLAVDMADEMMHLTLAVVGKTLLDADVARDAPEVGQAVDTLIELFDRSSSPLHILLARMNLTRDRRFVEARRVLDEIVFRIIRERRERPGDRGDLLSMLLQAADTDAVGAASARAGAAPADESARMSDQQVRDETMTLFLAGHETTALALTWAWYLLAQHSQVRERLQREVDEVLGDRPASFDDLPRLRYTENVIAETLRLYPPAWLLARSTVGEHELAGVRLKPRSMIVVSPWVMHRNPKYFPAPEQFRPERWAEGLRESLPKLAYLPFGGGNRVCIGEAFAWTEAILILATLSQRWQAELAPGAQVRTHAMITLRPRDGMPMLLTPRTR